MSGNKFLDSIQRKRGEFRVSLILRFRLLWSRFLPGDAPTQIYGERAVRTSGNRLREGVRARCFIVR
jgi:hypothetical protein